MGGVAVGLGWILIALSMVGALYACVAGVLVRRFFKTPETPAIQFPSVTILTPLHGSEAGLHCHLEALCTQDYPGAVQVIFGVHDAQDPAIGVVRSLQAAHPAANIELVIDQRLYGTNRKVSNQINMARAIAHEVVVMADSDIAVSPDYLRRLIPPLADPKIGFVTCAYVGAPAGGLWSALGAMSMDYHFLPSVALGLELRIATPCFGTTIACRREVLNEIGGFMRLADMLADDYELGRAVRALGYGFATPPLLIGHQCAEATFAALWAHELRWARTVMLVAPAGFIGGGITHPLPFALAGALLTGLDPRALAALALVLATRWFLMAQVNAAANLSAKNWALLPLRDLLSFAVYLGAFVARDVRWRGHRFRVTPEGALLPL